MLVTLAKKTMQLLDNLKCSVKKPGPDDRALYYVHFSLTLGELMALKHALEAYSSPVGQAVNAFMQRALEKENVNF